MSEEARTSKVIQRALVLVPALLLLSAAGAVWWYWHSAATEDPHPGLALGSTQLGDDELRDTMRKLTEYIGPRDWETPEGRRSLRQAVAFVSGTLSPRNYGYLVRNGGELALAGERWPTLWVDAKGTGPGMVLVAVPYDGDHVSMAAALALAGELREAGLRRTVRFAFYPSQLWQGMGSGASVLGAADTVVCVNRLGAGRDLWSVGPALTAGESYFRGAVDGHAQEPDLRKEALYFERSSDRVFEIRGVRGAALEDAAPEVPGPTEGRKLDDLRARVGRLGEILRGLANSA
jgi:hypothetical protein